MLGGGNRFKKHPPFSLTGNSPVLSDVLSTPLYTSYRTLTEALIQSYTTAAFQDKQAGAVHSSWRRFVPANVLPKTLL